MNPIALIFFLICAIALLSVPRKWAPAVLLVGCTYITLGQGIEIASINLHIYRMMLLIGLLRVITRGEVLSTGLNIIDKMLITWGVWAIFASLFHDPDRYGIIYACGTVFNLLVVYFLIRIWCNDLNEVREVIVVLAFLLVPLALEMLQEKITGKNLFSIFGAVSENVQSRGGKLRAQGPFLHAILAGTVGAACIPLFVGLYLKHKIIAVIGIVAGIVMTFTSASSGPVMTLMAGIGALLLWPFKEHLSKLRIGCVIMYFVLMGVMSRPPYYLIGEIDLAGGSTGWHRANLIEMTFAHLSEWWLIGTDFTRHWMPAQGIGADVNHTDITNYYIGMGIFAGLPSMLLIIGAICVAFRWVGQILDSRIEKHPEESFMIWCFGASLFAHAVTGISVAYFDQSVLFFLLTIAVISSSYSINRLESQTEPLVKDVASYGGLSNSIELTGVNVAPDNAEWRRRYRDNL
jgi:hypothetical protein